MDLKFAWDEKEKHGYTCAGKTHVTYTCIWCIVYMQLYACPIYINNVLLYIYVYMYAYCIMCIIYT